MAPQPPQRASWSPHGFYCEYLFQHQADLQRLTAASVETLLNDLELCLKEEKENPDQSGQLVALYGLGQTSVGPTLVGKVAEMFLDLLYE